jgi:hypothetical protein
VVVIDPRVVQLTTFSFALSFERVTSVGILLREDRVAIVYFSPFTIFIPLLSHIEPLVFVLAIGVSSLKFPSPLVSLTKK